VKWTIHIINAHSLLFNAIMRR